MKQQPPFHLAYPVSDLTAVRTFFTDTLGASVGREAERWVDLNFFGHQLSFHLSESSDLNPPTNQVDGDAVPTLHFGCVLLWEDWLSYYERFLVAECEFLIDKKIRFEGKVGEQGTFFVKGPCGIAIEFKSFKDGTQLFAAS